MKAIVYKSNTGFSKKLAELLGIQLSLPVYEFASAKDILQNGDEIIYIGWIMAGMISGFKKAAQQYNIKAVCAVGMSAQTEALVDQMKKQNNIQNIPLFYLRGGLNKAKLNWFYRFIMNIIKKSLVKKTEKTADDIEMISVFNNGADFVGQQNLTPIVEWFYLK